MINKTQLKPDKMGSYKEDDVIFLLRDISNLVLEKSTEERESLIQSGTHYSEMLPVEFQPNEDYISLFHDTLQMYSERIAIAVGVVAEQIKAKNGLDNLVLVSLARAGTPIGVLIKRYLSFKYKVNVPHYSISIIRGRGIDETAIDYIFASHNQASIQFVDGWTGKGAITSELDEACKKYNETRGYLEGDLLEGQDPLTDKLESSFEKRDSEFLSKSSDSTSEKQNNSSQTHNPAVPWLDSTLAVLADPGHCVSIYGTRDDFLIPSACLNSTVSGLVSRTVLNYKFMEKGDFHGAKFYQELADGDVSNLYIDTVVNEFGHTQAEVAQELAKLKKENTTPTWKGLKSVEAISTAFNITNQHFIKPGVGETTRVLLRRIPWKILVNPQFSNDLTHILMLAEERNVPVEEFTEMSYSCCGIIKEL